MPVIFYKKSKLTFYKKEALILKEYFNNLSISFLSLEI